MSEVKAYWHEREAGFMEDSSPDRNSWVKWEDAQSELAALREDRELWKGRTTNLTHTNAGLQQRLTSAEQRNAHLESREVMAETQGVLTFMRSDSDGSDTCVCCEGPHIFCRYFKGATDLNDLSQKIRFRNDLEGRRFRVVLELLPDVDTQPTESGASE